MAASTKKEFVAVSDRASYIGGSDAAACLGISRWDTRFSLWARKLGMGVEPDEISKQNFLLGKLLEPVCADLFQLQKPVLAMHAPGDQLFRHERLPFIAAHLDRWLINEETFLECKSAAFLGEEWDVEVEGAAGVPRHYVAQCDHCMMVMDVPYCFIAVFASGRNFAWWEIERNDKRERALLDAEESLWEAVQTETPPPFGRAADVVLAAGQAARYFGWALPKAKKQTRQVSAEEEQAWAELRAARRAAKAAQTKKSAALEQIILLSGGVAGKAVSADGEILGSSYWQTRESISVKNLRATMPGMLDTLNSAGFLRSSRYLTARAKAVDEEDESEGEDDDAQ